MGRPYLTELVVNALEARKNATVQAQDVVTTPATPAEGTAADGAAVDGEYAVDADGAAAASENSKNRCWFCQASAPELHLRKCRGCLKVRHPQSSLSIHLEFNAKLISRKT